jgi:hypothetical protein
MISSELLEFEHMVIREELGVAPHALPIWMIARVNVILDWRLTRAMLRTLDVLIV